MALVNGSGSLTRGELRAGAARFADFLSRRCESGEIAMAQVDDGVATAVVSMGCAMAGVPLAHVDPRSAVPRTGLLVRDGGPSDGDAHEVVGLRLSVVRSGEGWHAPDVPAGSQLFPTSGSTGAPKWVVRPPASVLADCARIASALDYRPGAAVVTTAPVFHSYGFNTGLVAPLLAGAAVRLVGPRTLPSAIAKAVAEVGAVVLVGLPFQYRLVVDSSWPGSPTLEKAVSSGAPLPDTVVGGLLLPLVNAYGSSETGTVSIGPVTPVLEPGTVGRPLTGVEVRVEGPDGELVVVTDSLAAGYLGPDGVRPLPVDGARSYRTGDRAVLGADGTIRLLGRIGDVINVSGKKVSRSTVERALCAHPAVGEAQVLAEADPVRGEVPVARVVLRYPVPVADLVRWARGRLDPHEVPRKVEIRDELPRSATGKPIVG
ncbi:class I adenylate-forming enzyme family protein [Umezawaea tangerina]|uniref:class I adenylate-forming enzyme family protein n=1 Tax=Umezawaea tangerina TaxID=84725 RepID=UPI0014759974|nr:AMP-binding protein [Umezawaea tangerina]